MYIYIDMHDCIHTYIRTCIHTYMRVYIGIRSYVTWSGKVLGIRYISISKVSVQRLGPPLDVEPGACSWFETLRAQGVGSRIPRMCHLPLMWS